MYISGFAPAGASPSREGVLQLAGTRRWTARLVGYRERAVSKVLSEPIAVYVIVYIVHIYKELYILYIYIYVYINTYIYIFFKLMYFSISCERIGRNGLCACARMRNAFVSYANERTY